MVMIKYGKEHGNKNEKPFEETSIYNKAELTCPVCPGCGENRRSLRGSCEYCGYNERKHTSYNAQRYDKEIITQGVVYSVYKVKGKRRRKTDRELDAEVDALIEKWGDSLLIRNLEEEESE